MFFFAEISKKIMEIIFLDSENKYVKCTNYNIKNVLPHCHQCLSVLHSYFDEQNY